MEDVKPMDICIDADGKLWRVTDVSITMAEIESLSPANPVWLQASIGSHVWSSFRRIFRPEKKEET